MYSRYGEYWEATYADPERVPPFQERVPSKSEIAYARLAAKTPHIVFVQDSQDRLVARGADHPGCRRTPNPQGATTCSTSPRRGSAATRSTTSAEVGVLDASRGQPLRDWSSSGPVDDPTCNATVR